jgi:hypothetical protein
MTGRVVSCTVTVKLPLDEFPAASTAVTVTIVVPSANTEPEAGELLVATLPLTASVALVVKLTVAPLPLIASVVMFAGTVMTGPLVSRTVTVNVPLDEFPAASTAVTVTVVVPSANTEPDSG